MQWVNLLAIAASPLIAVLVAIWIQNRKERRGIRLNILSTLMATRHEPMTQDNVRALNLIDLVFHDREEVRRLWREYFDMLGNEGLNNDLGWTQRNNKRNELVTEIAAVCGYGKEISHLDTDRVYTPIGISDQYWRSRELGEELLRVLKNTESLAMRKRRQTADQEPEST